MELSDIEFRKQFENCTLNPLTFNHEGHLRLVWIQIDKFGFEEAQTNIQNQLQNFVNHVGAKDKYHKTLTITAIQIVNQYMKNQESETFQEFIEEFPELKNNFRGLIDRHYSFDIFNSIKAKSEYLEPDLLSFD